MSGIAWMVAPVAACLVIALVLGWFGLQVLQRGVIFVDLALAQVAALGATYAVFLGHQPDEPIAYALGLAFTLVGAAAFAAARHFEDRVPQEALIGVAYVFCAAAAAMLLDHASDPHGAEKLQHLLVGNVVWVTWSEIGLMAGVSATMGLVHLVARRPLIEVAFQPEQARADGLNIALWDLVFYLTFGVVITAIVHVAGVLLIFSFLIMPAVVGRLFGESVGARLAVAWGVAVPVSVLGVAMSYEHAAGPTIVVLLGLVLLAALAVVAIRRSHAPGRLALVLVASLAVLLGSHRALSAWHPSEHHHDEMTHHDEGAVHDDLPADAAPVTREAWYRSHTGEPDVLAAALAKEQDDSLRLLLATVLARSGNAEGLRALASLAGSDLPFLRMEADDRLRIAAGDTAPDYDPLAAPDTGVWAAWAEAPPEGWAARAMKMELP